MVSAAVLRIALLGTRTSVAIITTNKPTSTGTRGVCSLPLRTAKFYIMGHGDHDAGDRRNGSAKVRRLQHRRKISFRVNAADECASRGSSPRLLRRRGINRARVIAASMVRFRPVPASGIILASRKKLQWRSGRYFSMVLGPARQRRQRRPAASTHRQRRRPSCDMPRFQPIKHIFSIVPAEFQSAASSMQSTRMVRCAAPTPFTSKISTPIIGVNGRMA